MNIILASKSPRRCELMQQAGFEFDIEPSDKEEIITSILPKDVVEELSRQKALDVYEKYNNADILVIGADTIVSVDNKILGKPKTKQEAYEMLKTLSGRTHEVYTGVCFVINKGIHTFNECTKVTFYEMTDDEIWSYVNTNDPMDKAGAYGIQGKCAIYIKEISGDYNNVVGLPISRLYQELKAFLHIRGDKFEKLGI